MHHIRRHFLKSPHDLELPDDKLRLPTELLILIASHIGERRDLVNLCRASRTFRDISIRLLYKVIEIDTNAGRPKLALQFQLYRSFQGVFLSNLVTHFSISLVGDKICAKRSNTHPLPSALRRCICDNYDQALGEALICLINVQYISIQCKLCPGWHAHDYLFQLDAPRLRQFAFRCFGSPNPMLDRLTSRQSILLAPFIPNVTALALECDGPRICPLPTDSYERLIQRLDVAPYLNTLSHDGSRFSNNLLAARPIQRLCLDSVTHPVLGGRVRMLHESLITSPGILSHLLSFDLLQWLPKALSRELEPYLHLNFIGTITLSECDVRENGSQHVSADSEQEAGALVQMEPLVPLCNLESIEINATPWSRQHEPSPGVPRILALSTNVIFFPGRRFVERLENRHPLLRQVFLTHRPQRHSELLTGLASFWWERGVGWERRPAPYLEYWDIVCDRVYPFAT